MTRFTESPYVRLMQQTPAGLERPQAAPDRPPGHPCRGCPYGRDTPCLGVCYRKLLKGSGKNTTCNR